MGYGRSYGMSGTAVPEWQQGLQKCKETMSCTKGRCMSYDGASNKCTCEKCSSLLVNGSKPSITPRYSTNNTRPPRYVRGMNDNMISGLSGEQDQTPICPPNMKPYCVGEGANRKCYCVPSTLMPGRRNSGQTPLCPRNMELYCVGEGANRKCKCVPAKDLPEMNPRQTSLSGTKTCPKGQSLRCHMGYCWCSNLVPGTTSVERMTTGQMPAVGVNGLGANFLDSVGNLANLAIIGLAIYGGFCLAKKL